MTNPIQSHLQATAGLIHAALEQMRHEDAEAFHGAATAFQAGAQFQVVTVLSADQLATASVCLVAPDGQVVTLAELTFESPKGKH